MAKFLRSVEVIVMTDIQRAMLGDHDAAARLTEQGALSYPECCNGCRWKSRHQKCSCCRRNANLKDCYEATHNNRAPILSAEEMEMLEGME